jgi:hypothetical protein
LELFGRAAKYAGGENPFETTEAEEKETVAEDFTA